MKQGLGSELQFLSGKDACISRMAANIRTRVYQISGMIWLLAFAFSVYLTAFGQLYEIKPNRITDNLYIFSNAQDLAGNRQ